MNVEITYQELKALRAELNTRAYVEDRGFYYQAVMQDAENNRGGGVNLTAQVIKFEADGVTKTADCLDLETAFRPYANKVVDIQDAWFKCHDLSDKRTWAGWTTGNPAAWFVGGVTYDEESGRWLDALGAPISAQYDDYHFRWVDNAFNSYMAGRTGNLAAYPFTTLAWLDQSAMAGKEGPEDYAQCVWRDAGNNALVQFDPGTGDPRDGDWKRVDANAPVDSRVNFSHFRINPDPGYKVQINQVHLGAEAATVFQAPMLYRVRSYYPPLAGVFTVRKWRYESLKDFSDGSNTKPGEVVEADGTKMVTIAYDYRASKPPVLDSRALQHIEISVEGHQRMTNTKRTRAIFVALKIASF